MYFLSPHCNITFVCCRLSAFYLAFVVLSFINANTLQIEEYDKLELTKWRKFRLVFTNFKLSLFFPALTWLLYHLDILSDVLQMHTLKENCHYLFYGSSIAILVVSFMVTAVYVKHHFNVSWFEAICYVRKFE